MSRKYLNLSNTKECIISKGIDMLDGTPVLDIKPYSEELNP
ncbi:TrmO family methyltransferase domain-containing protein [Clostridium botulinum]